jgi:hypothetical protein
MTSRRERVRWYGTAVVVLVLALALVVLGVSRRDRRTGARYGSRRSPR